ncbi:hypothetical protein BJ944DRAFT_249415 [Cunninghamella echinulata]|nr:hypothetical protein BJ944DRAFT_249415 [Cunninghamella echinulata]
MALKQVRFQSTHQIIQYEPCQENNSSLFNDMDFYTNYKRKSTTVNNSIPSSSSSSSSSPSPSNFKSNTRPIIPPLDFANISTSLTNSK